MKEQNPHSAQRLALDLQRSYNDLKKERERTDLLLAEVDRLQAELDRTKGSTRREVDSRLQAEEALNETEERLQFAVEAAGLALWDFRAPFTDVYLTDRWGELIGDVGLEGTWSTSDLLPRLHPEDAQRVASELRRLLKGETVRASGEYRFRAHDGWIWLETHAMVAETDEGGRVTRVTGTHANITARKQTEEKAEQARQLAEQARQLAEQASRAKSEFLANMSHEVRTPLNAIMGLNQLLLGTILTDEQLRWLQLMDDSSRSLLSLLNDVLDLSRIEAGKLQLELVNFPLSALFENTHSTYLEQARKKKIKLTLALSPKLPVEMGGDPLRVRQILTNLLSNALKFTPADGTVSISADVETSDQQSRILVIRIADSGIGIAGAQQSAMFDAFTQADASTARQFGGSGLGLAICSKLVWAMEGSIDLKSSLGHGSTFEVRLPLVKIAPGLRTVRLPASVLSIAEMESMRKTFHNLRVIVAEDNSINELLIKKLLERVGCEVRVARDGAEAVRLWREWTVDLILMDVQMPTVNGLTATAQIREAERSLNRPYTPIVAVTANAMPGDQETYMAAGMSGYVAKPINAHALYRAMAQAVEKVDGLPSAESGDTGTPREQPSVRDKKGSDRKVSNACSEPIDPEHTPAGEELAIAAQQLRIALGNKDDMAARTELEKLKQTCIRLGADRALRISRGLDMARHAREWGLFARALPMLESELDALQRRLNESQGRGTSDPIG